MPFKFLFNVSFCADYQKELETTQGKLEAANVDFQSRAVEYARLLDLRASKITKLETQLKVFSLLAVYIDQCVMIVYIGKACAMR